jgi:hypothetical protein
VIANVYLNPAASLSPLQSGTLANDIYHKNAYVTVLTPGHGGDPAEPSEDDGSDVDEHDNDE